MKNLLLFFILIFCISCHSNQTKVEVDGQLLGYYDAGEQITLKANIPSGNQFLKWSGAEGLLSDPYAKTTTLEVPAKKIISLRSASTAQNLSGIDDIDLTFEKIQTKPTTINNVKAHRAALYRWWRLMWRKGYDLSDLQPLADQLLKVKNDNPKAPALVDSAFGALSLLQSQDIKITEKQGRLQSFKGQKTNWNFYNGTDGHHTGYSPDQGATEGKAVWRFAKGYYSNASPVLKDGKLYFSTPAIDVMAMCLDENTGETIWKARQYGENFYEVHGSRWAPVLGDKHITVRTDYSPESIKVLDKATGKPFAGDTTKIVPFAYVRKGNQLVFANQLTGGDLKVIKNSAYYGTKPLISEDNLLIGDRSGHLFCYDLNGKLKWKQKFEQGIVGKISVNKKEAFIPGATDKLYKINLSTGEIVWTFTSISRLEHADQFFSQPLLLGDKLVVGTAAAQVFLLDQKTGKQLHETKVGDWVRAQPQVFDGDLYVVDYSGKMYRFNLANAGLNLKWKKQVSTHPITADLVAGKKYIYTANQQWVLQAISPETGNTVWKKGIVEGQWEDGNFHMADWAGGLLGSPVVADGIAYIGGPDGFVNAVDVETGKEIWKFEVGSTISIAPMVAEGKVFFGYLGANTEHYGYNHPGEVFALDAKTGDVVWRNKEYARVWVAPAYKDGKLFFGNTDGDFFGVNADTGQKLWSFYTGKGTIKATLPKDTPFTHGYPAGVYSVPVVDENTVYTGSWSGFYYAFDQQTGKVRWRTKTGFHDWGGLPDSAAPTLWKGKLYVQKFGSRIAAIDIKTGQITWEWNAPRGYLQNATVAAHDGVLYGSIVRGVTKLPMRSAIYAFDDQTHEQLWTADGMGGLTAPVIAGDQVIGGSSADVFLTSRNRKTGELLWRYNMGGEMLENVPAVYGNKVFALSKNGYLHAVK
ncbi:PQQ-binding-like beta-propeller repeat protein [Persicobacter diffluens]